MGEHLRAAAHIALCYAELVVNYTVFFCSFVAPLQQLVGHKRQKVLLRCGDSPVKGRRYPGAIWRGFTPVGKLLHGLFPDP